MLRTDWRARRGFKIAFLGLFMAACGSEQRAGTATSTGGNVSGGSPGAGQNSVAGSATAGAATAGVGSSNGGSGAGAGTAGSAGELTGDAGAGSTEPHGIPDDATVVLFLIDGLQTATVQTGIANGADNIKFLIDNGVTAQTVYTTSPAARAQLPDGTLPWDNATSGNVAFHTGCHLFESNQMDDIFLAAKKAGIKSVFAGGDANYGVFTTADFEYSGNLPDAEVVQDVIDRLASDHVRLMRLHLQRIRDFWDGPTSETTATSPYIQHLLEVDGLLGKLRQALEQQGVWNHTYVILSSDHGMGQSASSEHPPSTLSSWQNVMYFYGPGVKKGATIPYAESPDAAILAAHLLKLPPLQGHTDPAVTLTRKGTTGTLLSNIFEGETAELVHPRYIEKYLNTGTYTGSGTEYADYRTGMLKLLQ
jgi:hypothetical protein